MADYVTKRVDMSECYAIYYNHVLFIFFDLSESDIGSDPMRDIEMCVYSG